MSTIPYKRPQSSATEFSAIEFIVQRLISKVCTTQLVVVKAVTNAGGVEAVGTVDVQPMVHQVNGAGQVQPHGVIHKVPYFRLQGGTDAVILDPKVGDIGVAVFAMRDISVVAKSKSLGPPGSARTYDYADGLYFGGFLNGVPTQYFRFSSAGIEIVSPTKVTIQAPIVEVIAATGMTVTSPLAAFSGTLTAAIDVMAGVISVATHEHDVEGVSSGSSTITTTEPLP